jgi:hypothetical protein
MSRLGKRRLLNCAASEEEGIAAKQHQPIGAIGNGGIGNQQQQFSDANQLPICNYFASYSGCPFPSSSEYSNLDNGPAYLVQQVVVNVYGPKTL